MNIIPILNKIKEPFTNVDFYKQSINKPLWNSFGVLSLVIILMAFLSAAKFTSIEVPKFLNTSQKTITEATQNYPEDLTLKWNGQKLMSSAEDISIPWPSEFAADIKDSAKELSDFPEQFLYFHNSNQNPEQLNVSTNDYMIVVNSTNLYFIDDNNPNTWDEQSLATVLQPDMPIEIDKSSVEFFSKQAINFLNANVNIIKILFFTIFSILFYFSKFWFLVIETLLVALVFKLYKLKLTFKQTVTLTTHVMIPTVVLNTFAELIYTDIPLPLQTLTFWILIMFISFQFKKGIKKA